MVVEEQQVEYDPSIEDTRDGETRTREELQKSFDEIFFFLTFTTERENGFEKGAICPFDLILIIAPVINHKSLIIVY